MGTSARLLLEFLFLLCAIFRGRCLPWPCGHNLLLGWACVGRVFHITTGVTALVVASSATFSLFVIYCPKCHLRRLLLGVKHGIDLRDMFQNVVERRCRLTCQLLNQSLGHFWVALKFELVSVPKAFIRDWRRGFQLVSKHSETFITSGDMLPNFDS